MANDTYGSETLDLDSVESLVNTKIVTIFNDARINLVDMPADEANEVIRDQLHEMIYDTF